MPTASPVARGCRWFSRSVDFFAATTRLGGDELALIASLRGEPTAVVKSLTNDILVPADVEMTPEGYLDERGYVEREGPYDRAVGWRTSRRMVTAVQWNTGSM